MSSINPQQVHKNYKIAAYLIFGASAITLVNYLFHQNLSNGDHSSFALETTLLIAVLGYFSILGKDWLKWVLTFITIVGMFALQPVLKDFELYPWFGILNTLACGFQLVAVLFLFLAPKGKE